MRIGLVLPVLVLAVNDFRLSSALPRRTGSTGLQESGPQAAQFASQPSFSLAAEPRPTSSFFRWPRKSDVQTPTDSELDLNLDLPPSSFPVPNHDSVNDFYKTEHQTSHPDSPAHESSFESFLNSVPDSKRFRPKRSRFVDLLSALAPNTNRRASGSTDIDTSAYSSYANGPAHASAFRSRHQNGVRFRRSVGPETGSSGSISASDLFKFYLQSKRIRRPHAHRDNTALISLVINAQDPLIEV